MAMTGLTEVLDYLRKTCAVQQARDLSDSQLLERFLANREQAAFTVLVQRHGPMVFSVCKRVLGDGPGAEDAFQATFLVLVRRAALISTHRPLGNWLYGVAQRIAMRERAQTAGRRNRERRLADMQRSEPLDEPTWQELRGILDEEIARLPEKYRAPIVLCYFEGMSQERAAKELGWAKGSLARRLERGRELLRQQLVRRGIGLSAGALLTALAEKAAAAPVAAFLTINTVKAGMAVAAGKAIAGGCLTAKALTLAEEAMGAMIVIKAKLILMVIAFVVTIGGAGLAGYAGLLERKQPVKADKAQLPAPKLENAGKQNKKTPIPTDIHGDPLPEGAVARLGTTRLRHGESVYSAQLTGDGKSLVSMGGDGVRVWKADTGQQLHFIPRDREVKSFGGGLLSADGKLVVIPVKTGVSICEVSTGKQVKLIPAGQTTLARLSPDGKLLAVQSETQPWPFEVWDVASGELVCSGGGDKAYFKFLEFSADGKTLITAASRHLIKPPKNDYKIAYWDATTGKELRQIPLGTMNLEEFAISPDGKLFAFRAASFGQDNRVHIWDVESGKEIRQLDPDSKSRLYKGNFVRTLAFAPDSRTLFTSGVDGVVIAWDLATGEDTPRLGADLFPMHMAVSPDNRTIVACLGFTVIRLISLENGEDRKSPTGHFGPILHLAITPNGDTVVTGNSEGAFIWNAGTGKIIRKQNATQAFGTGLFLTKEGRNLMTLDSDRNYQTMTLRTRELVTGKELRSFDWQHKDRQFWVPAVSPDGKMLAIRQKLTQVILADSETGKEIRALGKAEGGISVLGAAFSANGSTLTVWNSDGQIRRWNVADGLLVGQFTFADEGKPLRLVPAGEGTFLAALSPDGRLAAFGGNTDSVAIYDLASGKVVHRSPGFPDTTAAIAFSADSRYVAWGGYSEPQVRLVEVATGRHCFSFAGHSGGVHSLAFSANAKSLVSGSWDTTGLVWDLTGQCWTKTPLSNRLAPAELDACWNDLAGEDAARAFLTTRRLAAAPADAVPYLGARLTPVSAVDEKRLARLAVDLDNDVFAVRQAAAKELEEIGDAAAGVLQKVLAGKPPLELSRRAQGILEKLAQAWQHPGPANLRILRALETLELAGTPEARAVLQRLAAGAPGAQLTQEANAALKRTEGRGQ